MLLPQLGWGWFELLSAPCKRRRGLFLNLLCLIDWTAIIDALQAGRQAENQKKTNAPLIMFCLTQSTAFLYIIY